MSLFDDLGGKKGMTAFAQSFYDKIQVSELAEFFAESNIPQQEKLLADFIGQLFGGGGNYNGKTMIEAHTGLGITNRHLAIGNEIIREALRDVGATAPQIAEAIQLTNTLRDQIVGL